MNSFKRKRNGDDVEQLNTDGAATQERKRDNLNNVKQSSSDADAAAAGAADVKESLDSAHVAFFAAHGYVVVSDVLSREELRLLQQECALLYAHVHSDKEAAADTVVEQVRLCIFLYLSGTDL